MPHGRSLTGLLLLTAFALAPACTKSPTEAPPAPGGVAAAPQPAPSGAPAAAAREAPTAGRGAPRSGDALATSAGEVRIVPVHHGTLRLELPGKVIWIDPWSEGDLSGPKADLVLITDIHRDHYDAKGLAAVQKPGTVVVAPPVVAEQEPRAVVMKNGDSKDFGGVGVLAVPMYNKVRGPEAGKLFHDKGRGNGYLLTLGDKKIYVSGDTECIDEMKALAAVDVAFVCMNLPYTMPPGEAAECIKAFRPKVVYPYHFRGSNLEELGSALAGQPGIEVRIRPWY